MKRFFFLLLAFFVITTSAPATASASSLDSLIKSARTYIGTPYVYGGTTARGFDCSGYTQVVFKNNGISIPRTTGQQYATGWAVGKNNLKSGDLVFFNTSGRGVSHVGIYIGSNNFIHASTSRGVMISSINDPYYWGSRYVGARRVSDFTPPPPPPVVAKPKPVAPVLNPDLYPSRVDIAIKLTEELGLQASNPSSIFKDISNDHPEISAIAAVAEAGIFTGSDGSFMPESNLSRAQLAKVLVESFNLKGSAPISFGDVSANHWAHEYIAILYHNNITTGYENGNFGVDDKVTKTQFIKFLDRLK